MQLCFPVLLYKLGISLEGLHHFESNNINTLCIKAISGVMDTYAWRP